MAICTSISYSQNGPSPIYGEPTKYQRFLVLDEASYPQVNQWTIEISHVDYDTLGNIESSRLIEIIELDNKSFVKLSENHINKYKNTAIMVSGYDNQKKLIVKDEWLTPPQFGTDLWDPLCEGICNASTYSYKVEIREKVNQNNQPVVGGGQMVHLTDAHFYSNSESQVYIPLYRYMTENEYESLKDNSTSNDSWYENNTLAHYGIFFTGNTNHIAPDGIKILDIPNAQTGEYRNYQNQPIAQGVVYGVQKTLGHYEKDRQGSHSFTDAEHSCGNLESFGNSHSAQIQQALNFTLYANQRFEFPNPQAGLLHYNQNLVCQNAWSLPGTSVSGGNDGWIKDELAPFLDYNWLFWVEDTENGVGNNDNDIFDVMEEFFDKFRTDVKLFENQTSISWWPGDSISSIQIYRVDRQYDTSFHKPFTIYRDSLINKNGDMSEINFTTDAGLYNLVLNIENTSVNIPYLFEVTKKMTHYSIENLCDQIEITIFPVPIENNTFTTRIRSEINLIINYKVIDEQGHIHYQKRHDIRENQTHDIIINDVNLPNGLIFHTFEIDNNCSRTITTIKNE